MAKIKYKINEEWEECNVPIKISGGTTTVNYDNGMLIFSSSAEVNDGELDINSQTQEEEQNE